MDLAREFEEGEDDEVEIEEVSILVLMDLARESWQFIIAYIRSSFNPCFNGSCSRIKNIDLPRDAVIEFQSLF